MRARYLRPASSSSRAHFPLGILFSMFLSVAFHLICCCRAVALVGCRYISTIIQRDTDEFVVFISVYIRYSSRWSHVTLPFTSSSYRPLFTIAHLVKDLPPPKPYTAWYGLTRNVKYRAYLFTGLFGFTYSNPPTKHFIFEAAFRRRTIQCRFYFSFCDCILGFLLLLFSPVFIARIAYYSHLSFLLLILIMTFSWSPHLLKHIVPRPKVDEQRKWERQLEGRCLIWHQQMA